MRHRQWWLFPRRTLCEHARVAHVWHLSGWICWYRHRFDRMHWYALICCDCGYSPPVRCRHLTTVGWVRCRTDINECATNNGGCSTLVKCANAVPGFSCSNCPEKRFVTVSAINSPIRTCVDVNGNM